LITLLKRLLWAFQFGALDSSLRVFFDPGNTLPLIRAHVLCWNTSFHQGGGLVQPKMHKDDL